MIDTEKIIYRLDDNISFRKCSLFDEKKLERGDCTNFEVREENWRKYFSCKQCGIHLHCAKHPEIELDIDNTSVLTHLICPKCQKEISVDYKETIRKCLKLLNMEKFKDAKLIRLDDWYIHELKEKVKTNTDYWITTDVKIDRDGDTIVILYIGCKGKKEKAQFFIKPEKLQLSSDHKDLDPQKVISKIEVTLKDRKLIQEYENE